MSCGDKSEEGVTLILYNGYKERFGLQKNYPSSHQMKEEETKLILTLALFGWEIKLNRNNYLHLTGAPQDGVPDRAKGCKCKHSSHSLLCHSTFAWFWKDSLHASAFPLSPVTKVINS